MISRTLWWIRIPLLFFLVFVLVDYLNSGEQPAFISYPIAQFFLLILLLLLIVVELIVKAIENVILQVMSAEAKAHYLAQKNKKWEWTKQLYGRMTRTKTIEEEGEIVLDHNYDGIRELDNVLPPWWVYMFYATIIFSAIYLVRFHIVGDYTQSIEYEREVAEAKIAIETYKKTAKNLIDVNTVEILTGAEDLNAGKKIFEVNCVACHMADGGGGIGPNLTDAYWILGGGIKNVFNTISEGGRDGKGMVAWKNNLKPIEMAQVASYVLQFQGTVPANPKDPDGELWEDSDAPKVNGTSE